MSILVKTDPKLDLVLDRVVDVPRELVWKAWTQPRHLMPWFTPEPWKTVDCRIDLRPGGEFWTLMRSPEGEDFPVTGCYLEVVENERLTWTDALGANFRPQPATPFNFSAVLSFEKLGDNKTRYLVQALHRDAEGRDTHLKMGFQDGWSKALDQLVAHCKGL